MPRSTLRNDMNGKSLFDNEIVVIFCSTSRERGPATVSPTIDRASTSKWIGATSDGFGIWDRDHRGWGTCAACEPKRKNSSGPMRETENSPTMRPCGFSIAVRFVRPIFGNVLVKRLCSHSADPSPLTLYLAKFDASDSPTGSRQAPD